MCRRKTLPNTVLAARARLSYNSTPLGRALSISAAWRHPLQVWSYSPSCTCLPYQALPVPLPCLPSPCPTFSRDIPSLFKADAFPLNRTALSLWLSRVVCVSLARLSPNKRHSQSVSSFRFRLGLLVPAVISLHPSLHTVLYPTQSSWPIIPALELLQTRI